MQRRGFLLIVFARCSRPAAVASRPSGRTAVEGQIIAITPDRSEATIKHGEIKGLMPAMTMPYKFKEKAELDAVKPGDIVDAHARHRRERRVSDEGQADRRSARSSRRPRRRPSPRPLRPGSSLLKPGETVPDSAFVDQDGRKKNVPRVSRIDGRPHVHLHQVPDPDVLSDDGSPFRHAAGALSGRPGAQGRPPGHGQLRSGRTDTPPVLKKHARELKADLTRWTFLTGDRDDIDKFATRFGMSVARAPNDARDITHNLRTAVISRRGEAPQDVHGQRVDTEGHPRGPQAHGECRLEFLSSSHLVTRHFR